jgi:hypothetical protein
MLKVVLCVEDFGHEAFLTALIERLAEEYRLSVKVIARSVRGGKGKTLSELRRYIRDLTRNLEPLPDLIIVGRDANCKGFAGCKKELDGAIGQYQRWTVYAIPDPHIERWLLLDSAAFRDILGIGCAAPDMKCNKDRYKELLANAIRAAGVEPLLGGIEYAQDLVAAMDLRRVRQADPSISRLIEELEDRFDQWKA